MRPFFITPFNGRYRQVWLYLIWKCPKDTFELENMVKIWCTVDNFSTFDTILRHEKIKTVGVPVFSTLWFCINSSVYQKKQTTDFMKKIMTILSKMIWTNKNIAHCCMLTSIFSSEWSNGPKPWGLNLNIGKIKKKIFIRTMQLLKYLYKWHESSFWNTNSSWN